MTSGSHFLTFDCYGTLVDWEEGISAAFAKIARSQGREIDGRRVLEHHAQIEPRVQAEEFQAYRDVLDLTAVGVATELGLELPAEQQHFLSDSLPSWRPFAETGAALERLKDAGYRLGILSNVDDDLLAGTLEHLPVRFDLLVTAEQVGSYKPATGHFQEARRRIGEESSWLHVAQSFFHDVIPACAMQIPVVWINRKDEAPMSSAPSEAVFPDLTSFVDRLLGPGLSIGS